MENNNWRNEDARQKIVNKIMDTLHRHMPQAGVDGMQELRKIAIRFEEKIFSNSQNHQDYLRKISMKMLSLEEKANNNNNQFPAGANQRPIEHTSVESSSQAGQPVMAEWQEQLDSMENNWRGEDVRQKIVNKIMDTLHRHMPQTGVDGMQELRKIAIRFEEKAFSNSQNQIDYIRKIYMKMLSLETKANNNNNQFSAAQVPRKDHNKDGGIKRRRSNAVPVPRKDHNKDGGIKRRRSNADAEIN